MANDCWLELFAGFASWKYRLISQLFKSVVIKMFVKKLFIQHFFLFKQSKSHAKSYFHTLSFKFDSLHRNKREGKNRLLGTIGIIGNRRETDTDKTFLRQCSNKRRIVLKISQIRLQAIADAHRVFMSVSHGCHTLNSIATRPRRRSRSLWSNIR